MSVKKAVIKKTRTRVNNPKEEVKEVSLNNNGSKYCPICGLYKDLDNFSKSLSNIHKDGKIHICNDCLSNLLESYLKIYNDLSDAIIILCSVTNAIVIKEVLESTLLSYPKTKVKKSQAFFTYLSNLQKYVNDNNLFSSTYFSFECSNFGGNPFTNCLMETNLTKVVKDDLYDYKKDSETVVEDIELTPTQIEKLEKIWGKKEDVNDLIWLEERKKSWYDNSEIPTDHISKSSVISLCQLELREFQAYNNGKDPKEILKMKQGIIDKAQFSPKKQAKNNTQNFMDLGSLIKKRETIKPIINKDPDFEDIDKISNISKALAGALCRTANIESPLVKEFEEIMKDYSFEFASTGDLDD